VSATVSFLVRKLAPMVDERDGLKWPVVERLMSDVLPTPWLPTASRRTASSQLVVRARRHRESERGTHG